MRVFRRKHTETPEVDMTPMIDMTFQLIAFFMVVTNFSAANQSQKIHLPSSTLVKPAETPLEYPINIQVTFDYPLTLKDEDGNILKRAKNTKPGMVILGGKERPISDLRSLLADQKKYLELSKRIPADATIIIRADADTQTETIQKIIKICQSFKFEKFVFRAKKAEMPQIR